MREIKFRGKALDGRWHYGHLSVITVDHNHIEAGTYIGNSVGLPYAFSVIPESVGQLTGLLDKNGTKIYEGDIVEITYVQPHEDTSGRLPYDNYIDHCTIEKVCYSVIFRGGAFIVDMGGDNVINSDILAHAIVPEWWADLWQDHMTPEQVETLGLVVVGNIFDNPEMIDK